MVLTEETAKLLGEMLDVVLEHGYEIDGDVSALDPEKFLTAAREMAEQDEEFAPEIASWLKESAAYLTGLSEGAKNLAIGKGRNRLNVGSEGRKLAKAAANKARRQEGGKFTADPEGEGESTRSGRKLKRVVQGWAS